MSFSATEEADLIRVARQALTHGVMLGKVWLPELSNYSDSLRAEGCCFITLKAADDLRGCIGTLNAYEPLIMNVARNTYKAAFDDHRFPQLSGAELSTIKIEISVLTAPEALMCRD